MLRTSTRFLVLPYDLFVFSQVHSHHLVIISGGLLTGYIICLSDCLELDSSDY